MGPHVSLVCALLTLGVACRGGPDPFDRADVVRTCVLNVSCLGEGSSLGPVGLCVDVFQYGIATWVAYTFRLSTAMLEHTIECGAEARDCMEALTCTSYGHGPAYCMANPGSTCDGSIRVVCNAAGWGYEAEDCAAVGLECREGMMSVVPRQAVCTDGTPCDYATFVSACEGSRLVECTSLDVRTSVDCTALPFPATCGTITNADGTTEQGCVPIGPDCDFIDARCEGTAIVACSAGHEARIDCSAVFEGHCELVDSGSGPEPRCVPDATECSTYAPDACDGGSLRSCVNGRLVSTPCADLGFAGCGADAAGNAICVP
jgi:hypothetical protein